ncbi:hypothetical protein DFS34DRAFT_247470 [Phlyctochytrium arcticum]|nr:hypothetical protein DFS34DRAFT_247470 [Phlyctochytrium arcticum]
MWALYNSYQTQYHENTGIGQRWKTSSDRQNSSNSQNKQGSSSMKNLRGQVSYRQAWAAGSSQVPDNTVPLNTEGHPCQCRRCNANRQAHHEQAAPAAGYPGQRGRFGAEYASEWRMDADDLNTNRDSWRRSVGKMSVVGTQIDYAVRCTSQPSSTFTSRSTSRAPSACSLVNHCSTPPTRPSSASRSTLSMARPTFHIPSQQAKTSQKDVQHKVVRPKSSRGHPKSSKKSQRHTSTTAVPAAAQRTYSFGQGIIDRACDEVSDDLDVPLPDVVYAFSNMELGTPSTHMRVSKSHGSDHSGEDADVDSTDHAGRKAPGRKHYHSPLIGWVTTSDASNDDARNDSFKTPADRASRPPPPLPPKVETRDSHSNFPTTLTNQTSFTSTSSFESALDTPQFVGDGNSSDNTDVYKSVKDLSAELWQLAKIQAHNKNIDREDCADIGVADDVKGDTFDCAFRRSCSKHPPYSAEVVARGKNNLGRLLSPSDENRELHDAVLHCPLDGLDPRLTLESQLQKLQVEVRPNYTY